WPAKIMPLQCEFHRGFEKAELVAGIVALAVKLERVNGTAAQEQPQRIGKLDLPARAWLHMGDRFENVRRQDIAPDDREIRRRIAGIRFLHQIADPEHLPLASVVRNGLGVYTSIRGDRLLRHLHHRQHWRGKELIHIEQLPYT